MDIITEDMEDMGMRENQNNSENLIDIFEICAGLYKRFREIWWLLLLIVCISTAADVIKEKKNYHAQYEASASFIVSVGGGNDTSYTNYYNKVTLEQLNTTFPYILTSGILNQIVAKDLGMGAVPGSISANVLEETNLFQIKVVSSEAKLAYDVLQSVIKNYPSVAKYVIGDTTLKLIDETGVPEQPMSYPNYKRAAAKGAVKGGIISLVIIVVLNLLRKTVKSQEDIKKFLNVKYFAGIPQEYEKKRSKEKAGALIIDQSHVSYAFREAISMLQVRLNRAVKEKDMKSIMVTSTLAGEGKTTISCNLAYAMAQKGYKVLLIDADFRNPSVASALDLTVNKKGIEDVLKGTAEPEEAICRYGESSLWVMPGINAQDKVAKLYKNGKFKQLLSEYKEKMDLIIVDTPPCGIMNDATLAAEYVEGVLLVIRQDYARREKIAEGVDLISEGHASLIGCVINGEENGVGSYGYGRYGYGRYGKYGYGKYGYGKYGYGKYGYGYGIEQEKES